MLERPRLGRSRPLTPRQAGAMRHLAGGAYIADDCHGIRIEPLGIEVPRTTLRSLVRAGLVHDCIPLFNGEAGRPTKHGWNWIRREFGE